MSINAVTAGPRSPRNDTGHGRANDRSSEDNFNRPHAASGSGPTESQKRIATAQARAALQGLALEPQAGIWRLTWVSGDQQHVVGDMPSLQATEGVIVAIELVKAEMAALRANRGSRRD